MRALTVVFLVALVPAIGGCHLRHSARIDECAPNAPYVRAQAVPTLKAAEGLPAPNTHNSLKVPDEVAAMKAHKPGTACLDAPPNFYADRPKPAAAK